jgi:lantibiotic modifying enzyme
MDNFAPPHKRTPSIALNSAKKYVSRVHRNSKLILTFNIMVYATREKRFQQRASEEIGTEKLRFRYMQQLHRYDYLWLDFSTPHL